MTGRLPRAPMERGGHYAHLAKDNFDRSPFTVAWEVTRAYARTGVYPALHRSCVYDPAKGG
jgi:hypothetical protein